MPIGIFLKTLRKTALKVVFYDKNQSITNTHRPIIHHFLLKITFLLTNYHYPTKTRENILSESSRPQGGGINKAPINFREEISPYIYKSILDLMKLGKK